MQARLNPMYWDGSRLGDDQALQLLLLEAGKGMRKFAANILQSELAGGYGQPIETYRTGSTFDPEAYKAGTVIIFERESLLPEEPDRDFVDMGDFTELPLPPRPSRRDLEVNGRRTLDSFWPDYREGGGLVYEAAMYVGVTAINSRGEFRLITMPAAAIREAVEKTVVDGKVQPGDVSISPRARPKTEARAIEVGKTLHLKGTRTVRQDSWTEEKLVRVNALEIVAN